MIKRLCMPMISLFILIAGTTNVYSIEQGSGYGIILKKVSNSNKVAFRVINGNFALDQNIMFYTRKGEAIGKGVIRSIYSDSVYAETVNAGIFSLLSIGDIASIQNDNVLRIMFDKEEFAIPIYISNHSFEYDEPHGEERQYRGKRTDISNEETKWKSGGDGQWHDHLITGWTTTGVSGTFRPTPEIIYDDLPDGYNIAFSNNGSISQILDHKLMKGFTYILKVYVGQRKEHKFGKYFIQLCCRNKVLAESNSPLPKGGEFVVSTVIYRVMEGDKNIDKPIEIKLITKEGQINYDNISLVAFESDEN